MNRFSITLAGATVSAFALMAAAPVGAHAGDAGQWMDTRHHLALGNLPETSESVARLHYAGHACIVQTGVVVGGQPTPAYDRCMKAQGFVWVDDSPAQIAAREKADKAAQWNSMLGDLGDALAASAASQPRTCRGQAFMGGHFTVRCD